MIVRSRKTFKILVNNKAMKGCIAKNIKQVQGEIFKGMQKQGRTQGHGKTIKKWRDNSEAYTEDKKHIQSKHVTIKITPIENGDNKVEKVLAENKALGKSNAEDNSNDTAKINNKSNAKQKRDTKETKNGKNSKSDKVTSETDVSVTLIDDAIIYSEKLPELLKKGL
jgi:hypothetical protein